VVGGEAVARDLGGVEEAVGEVLLKGEPEVSWLDIYAGGDSAEEAVSIGWVREIGDGSVALTGEKKTAAFMKRGACD